jgi:DNA (cytosine-5)-methyltransferase 1
MSMDWGFYEFFSGAGMVRAGLGESWKCLFANDIDNKKVASYRANYGEGEVKAADVKDVTPAMLPGAASLIWASFPCQDLSLAGAGAGLKGDRSGTFWPFWELMRSLKDAGRAPPIICLENVVGTLTSHKGADFAALMSALVDAGYSVGARVIDAVKFVPQSRPRLFIIGVRGDVVIPSHLLSDTPSTVVDRAVLQAVSQLDEQNQKRIKPKLLWWSLPEPAVKIKRLSSIIERAPKTVTWHTSVETTNLLAMMSEGNTAKLDLAKKVGKTVYGTIYKRTRPDKTSGKLQRAEVRFDGIAGCLRTPAGGSSRQIIIEVTGDVVRSRLISPREAARLMGLSEGYELPKGYNEAYHLVGDGVAVPVVRYLAKTLFEPLLDAHVEDRAAA